MKNIVIVLGAGASVDYGFPTGLQLTELIGRSSTCNKLIDYLISYPKFEIKLSLQQGLKLINEHFFKSRNLSIDAWLAKEENKECVEAAKLLISYYISISENSEFSHKGFFKKIYSENSNDWYREFYNQLIKDKFEEFPSTENKLSIITFNYDISLEYFLLNSLHSTYIGHSYEECWDKIKKINIYHVYGSLGLLPLNNTDESLWFGETHDDRTDKSHFIHELLKRSEKLKIIPELRQQSSGTIKEIRKKLSKAHIIFFIGFSYDPLNLELLGFKLKSKNRELQIYGTVYKMEEGEIENAKSRVIIETLNGNKHLIPADNNCDAYTFFKRKIIKFLK